MFLSQQKEVRWKGRKEGIVIKTGREGRGRREDSVQEKEREEEEGIPTGGGYSLLHKDAPGWVFLSERINLESPPDSRTLQEKG